MTTFSILNTDGTETIQGQLDQSVMLKCPFCIMVFEHYNADESCKCYDPNYRRTVMKQWGYIKKDFKAAGLER